MLFPDGVASDDLYALLGLSPTAPSHELEAAWRAAVQRWHPDRNPDPLATSRTAFINVAYGILRDRPQRARYDAGGLTRSSPPRRDRAHDRKRPSAAEERWRASKRHWAAEEERGRRFRDYFQLESQMKAAYSGEPGSQRRLSEALGVALLALPLLPQIVGDVISETAEFGRSDWVPAAWPPVTVGLFLAPLLQDESALDQIAGVLEAHDELASWRGLIEPARQSLREVSAILAYVRSHPGTIQARLGREIGQDQQEVTSRLCYWLASLARSAGREPGGATLCSSREPWSRLSVFHGASCQGAPGRPGGQIGTLRGAGRRAGPERWLDPLGTTVAAWARPCFDSLGSGIAGSGAARWGSLRK